MLQLIQRVTAAIQSRTRSEEGQTLVEYALIIAIVSIGLTLALGDLRDGIAGVFEEIVGSFEGAGGGGS